MDDDRTAFAAAEEERRPRTVDLREVLNALRCLARSGCGWRLFPVHFPRWQTVYWWFRQFVRRMLFQTIHDVALMMDRERSGREASPSAGVMDSQSVKAPSAKEHGFDGGKKVTGRKRHIAVDTGGRLLMINLTTADVSDSAGAQRILEAMRQRWPWMKHLFADSAYGHPWHGAEPCEPPSLARILFVDTPGPKTAFERSSRPA